MHSTAAPGNKWPGKRKRQIDRREEKNVTQSRALWGLPLDTQEEKRTKDPQSREYSLKDVTTELDEAGAFFMEINMIALICSIGQMDKIDYFNQSFGVGPPQGVAYLALPENQTLDGSLKRIAVQTKATLLNPKPSRSFFVFVSSSTCNGNCRPDDGSTHRV
ncbi:uncharacterized protein Dana_GF27202 [Drosophila ananassae]|uniref:Uncharacterized protein n=1 Tax=Drosophila ananassae TaxID=7217 RepID=A0A0N8P1Q4_DROAN|nr:uncharacterized protein LOC26514611 [Drosophila ananassae]KPU80572.1 uncharacterized protein Dana_GF27202 [Drosophila ananassae]